MNDALSLCYLARGRRVLTVNFAGLKSPLWLRDGLFFQLSPQDVIER